MVFHWFIPAEVLACSLSFQNHIWLIEIIFSHYSSNLSSIVYTLFWNLVEYFRISVFSLDFTPNKCKIHHGKENSGNKYYKVGSLWWNGQYVISIHLKLKVSCFRNNVPKEHLCAISIEVTQFLLFRMHIWHSVMPQWL